MCVNEEMDWLTEMGRNNEAHFLRAGRPRVAR